MRDKKRRFAAAAAGTVLAATLAAGQVAPFTIYAEGTKTQLNTSAQTETAEDSTEADTEAQTETEEKKTYEKVGSTDTSKAAVTAVDVSDVVDAVMPSIVTVTEKSIQEVQDYFGQSQKYEVEGAASGIIVAQNDDELLIATNNHVVEDSTEVTVCFSVDTDDPDDAVVNAKVKGTDADTDLAVIAVSLKDIPEKVLSKLKVAVLGSSDNLKVGSTAITIGNTLGNGLSVTSGIISAVDVEIQTDDGSTFTEFQTDGAANQGQSGGAVVNAKGEVIGVFNAGALEGDNVGFAVPISTAIPVLEDLINRKTRDVVDEHGYMGITIVPVSEEASQMYNIPKGAYVYDVEKDSAGDEAGIKKGDIITGFDGITISSQSELLKQITYYKPGETVEVIVQRPDGTTYKEKKLKITLKEASEAAKAQEKANDSAADNSQDESEDQTQGDGSVTLPFGDSGSDPFAGLPEGDSSSSSQQGSF